MPDFMHHGWPRHLRLLGLSVADGCLVIEDAPRGFVIHQAQNAADVVLINVREINEVKFDAGIAQSAECWGDVLGVGIWHSAIHEDVLSVLGFEEDAIAFVGLKNGELHTVRSFRSLN